MLLSQVSASCVASAPSIPSRGYEDGWGIAVVVGVTPERESSVAWSCGSISGSSCGVGSCYAAGVAQFSSSDGATDALVVISPSDA